MGSNISLVNRTDHNLHVCLKQVTPMHFENYIGPGQSLNREVMKVWFTIEARIALRENEYSTTSSVLSGFVFTGAAILSVLNPAVLTLGAAGAVGAIAASNNGGVIWSPGWYMGFNRRIEIRSRVVEEFEMIDPANEILSRRVGEGGVLEFYLVEVCPSGCGRESKGLCRYC